MAMCVKIPAAIFLPTFVLSRRPWPRRVALLGAVATTVGVASMPYLRGHVSLIAQHVLVGVGQPGGRAVGLQAEGDGRRRRRRGEAGRHGQIARDAQRLLRRIAAQIAAPAGEHVAGVGGGGEDQHGAEGVGRRLNRIAAVGVAIGRRIDRHRAGAVGRGRHAEARRRLGRRRAVVGRIAARAVGQPGQRVVDLQKAVAVGVVEARPAQIEGIALQRGAHGVAVGLRGAGAQQRRRAGHVGRGH